MKLLEEHLQAPGKESKEPPAPMDLPPELLFGDATVAWEPPHPQPPRFLFIVTTRDAPNQSGRGKEARQPPGISKTPFASCQRQHLG